MAFWFLYSFAALALILVQAAYCLFSVAGTLSEKRWYGIIAMATIKWLQWLLRTHLVRRKVFDHHFPSMHHPELWSSYPTYSHVHYPGFISNFLLTLWVYPLFHNCQSLKISPTTSPKNFLSENCPLNPLLGCQWGPVQLPSTWIWRW